MATSHHRRVLRPNWRRCYLLLVNQSGISPRSGIGSERQSQGGRCETQGDHDSRHLVPGCLQYCEWPSLRDCKQCSDKVQIVHGLTIPIVKLGLHLSASDESEESGVVQETKRRQDENGSAEPVSDLAGGDPLTSGDHSTSEPGQDNRAR